MKNITIIGSGSFGCALAYVFSNMGHKVKIWSFKKEEADLINNKHKCMYLKDLILKEDIKCSISYEESIKNSEYIFIVTPSSTFRITCKNISKFCKDKKIIICSKGLEENTNEFFYNIAIKELKNNKVGILSGPSIATELIQNKPATVIFSSKEEEFNQEFLTLFSSKNFKLETTNDIIGVELGGSLKNIGALAIGMIEEKNLGENFKASVLTKILEEMITVGQKLGANPKTFYGLSGLGDLIVTCSSDDSRNKRAGVLLAQGKTILEVKEEIGMVIEGLESLKIAYNLSKNLNLKIIPSIYKIIYKNEKI